MKQSDIVVGGTYTTLVSGLETRVRVLGPAVEPYSYSDRVRRAEYPVENLKTGNRLKRTAAALRARCLGPSEAEALIASRCAEGYVLEVTRDAAGDYTRFTMRAPLVAMPAIESLAATLRAARVPVTVGTGKLGTDKAGTCAACFVVRAA